jgi:Dolichyl-phosphate-mannose-protein mannosyltransferase
MPESSQIPSGRPLPGSDFSGKALAIVAGLTALAFLVMGYHPGLEDDSFYLAAIKWRLNPALFPHDSDFFRLQFQATIFDRLMAFSIQLTHLPILWALLLWQIAAIFLFLLGCWRIARRCFAGSDAQWGAVATIAALLSLPLPGVAILLCDPYLHPRTLATAAILAAIVAVLDRKLWRAGPWLLAAFLIHAIMACLGISFCVFLFWSLRRRRALRPSVARPAVLPLIPLGWLFEPASDAWRQAAATRGFLLLGSWHWYEWLGVFAPLVILFSLERFLRERYDPAADKQLLPLISGLIYYGTFQTVVGIAVMLPVSLERLRPLEPMRYLHLLYVFFFLVVGGLLGRYLLDRRIYRWMLLFVPLSVGMFHAQRQMYSASPHLELPFRSAGSDWLRAFDWIRRNTAVDSLFALDPHYEKLPGEEFHGFRALAERSVLADYEKDAGMAARVPGLAPRWLAEVTALNGWRNFQPQDFERLKNRFGVTWVVLSGADAQFSAPDPQAMICPYANQELKVCHLR